MDIECWFAQMQTLYEQGATREETAATHMRQLIATTKAGMQAFQMQMRAEEQHDAQAVAGSAGVGVQAPPNATLLINPMGQVVAQQGAVDPNRSLAEEQLLLELGRIANTATGLRNNAGEGDGMATD